MSFLKSLFGKKEAPQSQHDSHSSEDTQSASIKDSADDDVAEKDDRDFDILKYDGVRAMHTGAIDYALKCFRHALTIRDDLEIHDYMSRILTAHGQFEEAYAELKELLVAEPENLEILVRMARLDFMMEDYEAMSADCERASLVDNGNAVVAFLTAQACKGKGDQVGALAMLTRAITLADDYGDAYLLRGELLLEMSDVDGADQDACWLLERTKDNEDVLMLKGRIEQRRNNADAAIDYFTQVIAANPFHADAYRERGAVKMAQGDTIGATEDAEHAMELMPESVANVNGDFSAEGIEQKTRQAYRDNNPFGLG